MYEYWNMATDEYGYLPTYMQEFTHPLNCNQFHSQIVGADFEMGILYPDIYYKVYPYVSQVCDRMDTPYTVYPSEELLETMVDECYDMCVGDIPELEEYAQMALNGEDVEGQQVRRRRPLLRDLIAIILLTELFRRRRRRRMWGSDEYYM